WIVHGGSGTGKTSWVASLLRQQLEIGRPCGVLDCKADLFHLAVRLNAAVALRLEASSRRTRVERTAIVNPFSDELVPLNVCCPLPGVSVEVQAYEVTLALSRLFDTGLGLHMDSILRHLLVLLIEARLSLVEAPEVLQDEVLRGVLAVQSA